MNKINNSNLIENIKIIAKGSIISIIITLILLLVFSIVLTYTSINENLIKPVIIVVSTISVLIGTSIGSIKIKNNGIINGGLIGLFYIITIYFVSSLTGTGFCLNMYSIIMIGVNIIAGMIGGIIGINLK